MKMSSSAKTYKCPSCGGDLEWSPKDQKLKCPYCGSVYDLSVFEKQDSQTEQELDRHEYQRGENAAEKGYDSSADATDDSSIDPRDLRVYRCSVCGAEVVTDKTTIATECAFCGNPVVLTEQLDTKFRPKWIIPFNIPREQVGGIYRNYVKTRPFTPANFRSEATVGRIKGVYVPFWMYRMNMQGNIRARGERVFTREDARYIYTTHQVFSIERGGSLQINDLPVDASTKAPDDAMDSVEPFDYGKKKEFRMPYMAGFLAERYDQDAKECYDRALRRSSATMEEELRSTIRDYASVTVTDRNIREADNTINADYALLPVYLLPVKYKDKDYLFAINGQTGKITGNVPISGGRAAGFFAGCFGIVFGILWLINFLLMAFVF